MTIDGIGSKDDAARRAAEETARRAARRAAEEAANRQAEVARQAQAAHARDTQNLRHGAASLEADAGPRGEHALAAPSAAAHLALSRQVEPIDAKDAQERLDTLRKGLAGAENPETVAALDRQAQKLVGRLAASNLPHLAAEAGDFAAKAGRAHTAVGALLDAKQQIDGPPGQAAGQIAAIMARPQAFVGSLKGLHALEGSPLHKALDRDFQGVVGQANSATLATKLAHAPDLTETNPQAIGDLAALRQVPDPALQGAIDQVGASILDHGLNADDLKADPGLVPLVAPLDHSSDPALREKLHETVHNWVKRGLEANLQDKHGEDGVKDAMAGFKQDMTDLAKTTGLGPLIARAAGRVLDEQHDQLEDIGNEGKSWLSKAMGFLGDLVGDVTHAIGDVAHVVGQGVAAAGHAVEQGLHYAGEAAKVGLHYAGEGVGFVAHIEGKVIGAGLDLVGAHGLADDARDAADAVDHGIEHAADATGNAVGQFADGAGEAIGGLGVGAGMMIEHPATMVKSLASMVRHPELLAGAGKALWKQASEGGWAHAAGYIAGTLLPTLLSGGAGDVAEGGTMVGEGGTVVGEGASITARVGASLAQADGALGTLGEGLVTFAEGGSKVTEFLTSAATGKVFEAGGKAVELVQDVLGDTGGKAQAILDQAASTQRIVEGAADAGEAVAANAAAPASKLGAYLDRAQQATEAIAEDNASGLRHALADAASGRLEGMGKTLDKLQELREGGLSGFVQDTRGILDAARDAEGKLDFGKAAQVYGDSDLKAVIGVGSKVAGLATNPLGFLEHGASNFARASFRELPAVARLGIQFGGTLLNAKEAARIEAQRFG